MTRSYLCVYPWEKANRSGGVAVISESRRHMDEMLRRPHPQEQLAPRGRAGAVSVSLRRVGWLSGLVRYIRSNGSIEVNDANGLRSCCTCCFEVQV